MSPAEAGNPKALRELMGRVGASVSPAEFVDAVVNAFRYVDPIPDAVVYGRFRRSAARQDFREMLRRATLPAGARVLCIGCGEGLAGRSSVYASAVVREIYPTIKPELFDIDHVAWNFQPGSYACVVTHSLLHFVYDPYTICESIHGLVAPGGVYIMANEPNSRFWGNPACVRELRRVDKEESRRRRLRRYADPSRYWSKLVRTVQGKGNRDLVAAINRMLRDRLRLQEDLTIKEIVRLVDPHQPDANPGDFVYGSDGLDWTELSAGFKLEAVRTSGYIMRDNPARIPARWRELQERLSSQFPLDGCSYSAFWRK